MSTTKINYIEMPASDIAATKQFFNDAFGWEYIDYGPDYAAIKNAGIDGGFYSAPLKAQTAQGSVLVVLYSPDLQKSLHAVEQAGGEIIKPIFSFPGGHLFHFTCPSGNEYAVWSE